MNAFLEYTMNCGARPANEQFSALFFPDKSVANSATPEGWIKGLVCLGRNPNKEPNLNGARKRRHPPPPPPSSYTQKAKTNSVGFL